TGVQAGPDPDAARYGEALAELGGDVGEGGQGAENLQDFHMLLTPVAMHPDGHDGVADVFLRSAAVPAHDPVGLSEPRPHHLAERRIVDVLGKHGESTNI